MVSGEKREKVEISRYSKNANSQKQEKYSANNTAVVNLAKVA